MKQIFTILFLMIYLILSLGMNILVHTCSGESTATVVTTKVVDPCACNDESSSSQTDLSMMDMCCTTELKSLQIDDAQTITPANIEQNLVAVSILPTIEISTFDIQCSSFVIFTDTSPPPNKNYQISNSVFLI